MLTRLKNSRLFTQTVIPIITIGALLAYIGSSMLNALLLERFEAEQQQQLNSASRYIDQMFKNHYKLLFYLYGTDAKDFAKQNSISKKEILEKLSHLYLPNKDAIVIFSEDGSILFQSKHLQTQNDNQIEQNYIKYTFAFKPWKWQINYILDTTNIQEIAKSNHDFMVATLLIIVTLLSITLLGIFYIIVQKPLQTISLQLNNIIEGKYTQLSTNKLFGKEFRHLANHLNKVTRVIQTRESDAKAMLLLSQQNEAYVKDILDSQHDIIVINNSHEIVDVNQSFFLFFDNYQNLEAFKKEHSCICDYFEVEKGYIYKYDGENWIERLLRNETDNHRVKIIKNAITYIFLIRAAKSKVDDKVILTLIDMTEIEKNKLKLIEAKEAAEAATKTKSIFLANMSHEIRTPLNGILGFLQIMLKKEMSYESQKRYFLIMQQNGKNLLNIINDILDFSKIESDKMEISLQECNIKELMEKGTAHFFDLAKEKNITYILNVEASLPKCLLFDDVRLNQVIYNLLSNALKFTPEGGEITLKIKQNNNKTLFFGVIDNGIGIAKHNQEKIFKAFEQENLSTTKRFGGTGLGLSISSTLVVLMGGEKLKLKSELGQGSQFYFELPMKECKKRDGADTRI